MSGRDRQSFELSFPMPTIADRAAAERHQKAVRRTIATLQDLANRYAPEELEEISLTLERALDPPTTPATPDTPLPNPPGTECLGPREQRALDFRARLRAFQRRNELLCGALTTSQVAKLLGTSRQTPHDRIKNKALLAILDRGTLRFPPWQFDPSGSDRVLTGLPAVLKALHVSPLGKASWLTSPSPLLDGRTPLDVLRSGDVELVIMLARGIGVN